MGLLLKLKKVVPNNWTIFVDRAIEELVQDNYIGAPINEMAYFIFTPQLDTRFLEYIGLDSLSNLLVLSDDIKKILKFKNSSLDQKWELLAQTFTNSEKSSIILNLPFDLIQEIRAGDFDLSIEDLQNHLEYVKILIPKDDLLMQICKTYQNLSQKNVLFGVPPFNFEGKPYLDPIPFFNELSSEDLPVILDLGKIKKSILLGNKVNLQELHFDNELNQIEQGESEND